MSLGSVANLMPESINSKFPNSSGIPLLSFFTGAGFLDIGFMQAGFDVIWSNEYDSWFVRGYEYGMSCLNINGSNHRIYNTSSIVTVGPNQIAKEAFHNTPLPETFGIIGGPPCPDFSVGGKNRGREGENGKLSKVSLRSWPRSPKKSGSQCAAMCGGRWRISASAARSWWMPTVCWAMTKTPKAIW